MKSLREIVASTLLGGVLVVLPLYLAILLVLKAVQSMAAIIKPLVKLLPESVAHEQALALLALLVLCFVVGAVIRTEAGKSLRNWLERSVLARIPGYTTVRSLTRRLAGAEEGTAWQPALVEIEEGLVPGFIIERLGDGRCTVFVPSVPTPFAGAVYVLDGRRVHPLDVPMTQAMKAISRWGAGSAELVAAMERRRT